MKTKFKLLISLLFLFIICAELSGQNSFAEVKKMNCVDFKTGKFEVVDTSLNHHIIFERNKDFQIEKNQNSGAVTKCKVKWINNCTYVLTYLETEEKQAQEFIGKTLTVTITKIEGVKYYFDAFLNGNEIKISHYVTKLN
ncbi:MAG: hypothetical protein ABJL44_14360 [Algibacter sp.]